MNQELLAEVGRRHSSLHDIDKQCTTAMGALVEMVGPAFEHGLQAELQAVHDTLLNLHKAAKQKFERSQ